MLIRTISVLLLFIVLISGCINGEKKPLSINIPNLDAYKVLYIQGVDDTGAASEVTSKYITDQNEIEKVLTMVNNMEVIKPSHKEMSEKVKELNNQGNYFFALSDSKTMNNIVYYMNFYEDGSIQFQDNNKKELRYLSKEKEPNILKELKKSLEISF